MLLPGIATPSCSSSPMSFQSTIFLSRAVNTRAFICSDLGIVATISAAQSFSSSAYSPFTTFSSHTTTTRVGLLARVFVIPL